MKKFPIKITEEEPILTLPYTIYFGNTSVAFCDNETRANMIKRALEIWQNTKDYQKWFKEIMEPINKIKITSMEIR